MPLLYGGGDTLIWDHGHSYEFPDSWPPNSPDLIQFTGKHVYQTKVQNVNELRQQLIEDDNVIGYRITYNEIALDKDTIILFINSWQTNCNWC